LGQKKIWQQQHLSLVTLKMWMAILGNEATGAPDIVVQHDRLLGNAVQEKASASPARFCR